MEKSVQFAARRRQIAPPAFSDNWAFPFNGRYQNFGHRFMEKSVQFAARRRQIAPPAEWATRR